MRKQDFGIEKTTDAKRLVRGELWLPERVQALRRKIAAYKAVQTRARRATAAAVIERLRAGGVELFIDGGRLRYRAAPGAYTEPLRRLVATHFDEIVTEFADAAE